jgi:organic hydroperoxide reductase OsmC/OhrA
MKAHHYQATIQWTGNEGSGTSDYKAYSRNHLIAAPNKSTEILGSSDPAFRGDKARYNPEDLLVASISACHQLWYLHLCAVNKVVVVSYIDNATGTMIEKENGSGSFSEVILNPIVTVREANMVEKAYELHQEANKICFIANSCNFPIRHKPQIEVCVVSVPQLI